MKLLTAVYLAPLCKVAGYNLFDVICHMYSANVESTIHPHERANSTHVVPVVAVFVSAETGGVS